MFQCKARGTASSHSKQRIFFTCHPEDHERFFDEVSSDLLRYTNCDIWFHNDTEYEDMETDLSQMSLFAIPVTKKLLTESCRAMDADIPFALSHNIPILPMMQERGLDELFRQKFGDLQYLDKNTCDETAISYNEKLKKYLSMVFVHDNLAEKIESAFDAHIFLSYRKIDRKYANELIRAIHSYPPFRDIAIWYDEFLIPGENFNSLISNAIIDCDLFVLLVTPNVLAAGNYVLSDELPSAISAGKKLLPIEAEQADISDLRVLFGGIPECTSLSDHFLFNLQISMALIDAPLQESINDPMHNYLIGLAYMNGIGVEINRKLAIELVSSAAEAGLIEAMEKLYDWYYYGLAVKRNLRKALVWSKRIYEYYLLDKGEQSVEALTSASRIATTQLALGDYDDAFEVINSSINTIRAEYTPIFADVFSFPLNDSLSILHSERHEYREAQIIAKKNYEIMRQHFGETNSRTISAKNTLACVLFNLGDKAEAIDLLESAYAASIALLGSEDKLSAVILSNLAISLIDTGAAERAKTLLSSSYDICLRHYGELDSATLSTLAGLSKANAALRDYCAAISQQNHLYKLYTQLYGETHLKTLNAEHWLAWYCYEAGEYDNAGTHFTNAYKLLTKNKEAPAEQILANLQNMAACFAKLGNRKKCIDTLGLLAREYCELGDSAQALKICEIVAEEPKISDIAVKNILYVCKKSGQSDLEIKVMNDQFRRSADMIITAIQFCRPENTENNTEKSIANVAVMLNDVIAIHDITILERDGKPFVRMPSWSSEKAHGKVETVSITDQKCKRAIEKLILSLSVKAFSDGVHDTTTFFIKEIKSLDYDIRVQKASDFRPENYDSISDVGKALKLKTLTIV